MPETVAIHTDKPFDLKEFKIQQILFNDAGRKKICLLGGLSEAEADRAIVIIEKGQFVADHFSKDDETKSFLKHLELETTLTNSIYSDFVGIVDKSLNGEFCKFQWMSRFRTFLSRFRAESLDYLSSDSGPCKQVFDSRLPRL